MAGTEIAHDDLLSLLTALRNLEPPCKDQVEAFGRITLVEENNSLADLMTPASTQDFIKGFFGQTFKERHLAAQGVTKFLNPHSRLRPLFLPGACACANSGTHALPHVDWAKEKAQIMPRR